MTKPTVHGKRRFVPASEIQEAIGESLQFIREQDGLTWKDMGEALGRSEDQAGKYALGTAEMSATTVIRAIQHWNGRFINPVLALFGMHIAENSDDGADVRKGKLCLLELMTDLERALMDGELSDEEVEQMGGSIENAGALIDQLRDRLAKHRVVKAELRIVKEG
jgi:transcriptional regulator with XRE-family HTH domain